MIDLQPIIEEYLLQCMAEGVLRDTENNLLPEEYFPDVLVMMMNEDYQVGRLSNGLVGYVIGAGLGLAVTNVLIPRTVSLACLELLRPYALDGGGRPDLLEIVQRCDRANNKFLTGKDIEESGATNVTTLH